MTIMTKTLRASELPADWQRELGIDLDRLVKVEIEELDPAPPTREAEELIAGLMSIVPVTIEGDVTAFIRAERDRIDGRGSGS